MPPKGPSENSNVLLLSRPDNGEAKTSDVELKRRRTDIHDELTDVVELRPGIANRRKEKPVTKARGRAKKVANEKQVPGTVPAIAGGKRVENVKVAAAVDGQYVNNSVRESDRVERVAGSLDLTGEAVSPEDTARALLRLRDEDFEGAFSDTRHTFHDDDDLFIPVAKYLLLMFPGNRHWQHVDDKRVESLVAFVRDPDTMYQRLLDVLKDWKKRPISGKRTRAVIKGK